MIFRFSAMIILSLFVLGCHQNTVGNLEEEIDQKVQCREGLCYSAVQVEFYENDTLKVTTYDNDLTTHCVSIGVVLEDSVRLHIYCGMFVGFGLNLYIKNEDLMAEVLVKTDEFGTYKLHEHDSTLHQGVNVPANIKNVSWVGDPKFETGELVKGFIEVHSDNFWKVSDEEITKERINIKAWFKIKLEDSPYEAPTDKKQERSLMDKLIRYQIKDSDT